VKECVKLAEILCCTIWGRDLVTCSCVWLVQQVFQRLWTGHTNRPHAYMQPTAVTDMNSVLYCIQSLHKCWKCRYNNTLQESVCVVGPKMLTFDQKVHVSVSSKHLNWFELERKAFLQQIVICDETWVHDFTPESGVHYLSAPQRISTSQRAQVSL